MSDIKNFTDYLSSMIGDKTSEIDSLKRCSGKVTSVIGDGGKAVVECMGRSLTLLNKTGENLYEGDSVWVHYWTNLANGYIAIRNGLPNIKRGQLSITNAVAMLENQSDIFTVSTEVFDVDVENSIKVKYGDPKNIIIASEIPILVTAYDNTYSVPDIYDWVTAIPTSLLSTERKWGSQSVYTAVIGTCDTTYSPSGVTWKWGADVLLCTKITMQADTDPIQGNEIYNICLSGSTSADQYTLRKANGDKAYFTTFDDLGAALLTKQICAPTTYYPYGYVVCRAVGVARNDNESSQPAVSVISQRTFNIPFKNEAEYNYAITTLTKSELNPT